MNNIELLSIIRSYRKIDEIQMNLKKLKPLLNVSHAFQKDESKIAIANIQKYCEMKKQEISSLKSDIERIKSDLEKNCKHPVVLSGIGFSDCECPLCKNTFKEENIPSTVEYVVSHIGKRSKIMFKINRIVIKSNNAFEAKEQLLNFFEPLQYDNDVVIRRLVNDKRTFK